MRFTGSNTECVVTGCSYLLRPSKKVVEAGDPADDRTDVAATAADLLNPVEQPGPEGTAAIDQAAVNPAEPIVVDVEAGDPADDRTDVAATAADLLNPVEQPGPEGTAAIDQAAVNQAEPIESSHLEPASSNPEEDETGFQAQPFLRLQLQGLIGPNRKSECYLDYYINCEDCGEFIVAKDRYQKALRQRYKYGDKVVMFWRDPNDIDRGNWFRGTVRSTHRRASSYSEHLLKDCDWESVEVYWEATAELSRVSSWELRRADQIPLEYQQHISDDDIGEQPFDPADYHDDDYNPHRQRGGNKRRRVIQDSLPQTIAKGSYNTLKKVEWSDNLCHVCHMPDNLIRCGGQCLRSFHAHCIPASESATSSTGTWYCKDCKEGRATCTICKESGVAGKDVFKCKMGGCGSFYHLDCLKTLPEWSVGWGTRNSREEGAADLHIDQFRRGLQNIVFVCPGHFCHECHLSGDALKIVKCSNCNIHAYHMNHVRWNHCLKVASDKNLICPYCTYNSFAPKGASQMPDLLTYTPTYDSGEIGRVTKWNGSKVLSQLVLVGKKRFLFGSHSKGGGCDFTFQIKGVKFHSEITAESPGRYSITSNATGIRGTIPLILNDEMIPGGETVDLKHGDTFEIGSNKFMFEFIAKEELASLAKENKYKLLFPDELSLQRPKAIASHSEENKHMDELLENFDISGYNRAFSKLGKLQLKRKTENTVKIKNVEPTVRSARMRKPVKYDDMFYSDEEEEHIIAEPRMHDGRKFARNPIAPPPLPMDDEPVSMDVTNYDQQAQEEKPEEADILGALGVLAGALETNEQFTQTGNTFSDYIKWSERVHKETQTETEKTPETPETDILQLAQGLETKGFGENASDQPFSRNETEELVKQEGNGAEEQKICVKVNVDNPSPNVDFQGMQLGSFQSELQKIATKSELEQKLLSCSFREELLRTFTQYARDLWTRIHSTS